jgi:hypothetical protein
MKNELKFAALVLLFALVSCGDGSPGSTESPLVVEQGESPIATPLSATPVPTQDLPIPTQDPQAGSIEGSIVMEGHSPGMFPATLYLGDPTGANPIGAYVALDIATAMQGYVKPDGTFVFPNVPPGIYSIIAWTPTAAYIVPNPSTGETWLIEITGNSHFDAGHILVPAVSVQE